VGLSTAHVWRVARDRSALVDAASAGEQLMRRLTDAAETVQRASVDVAELVPDAGGQANRVQGRIEEAHDTLQPVIDRLWALAGQHMCHVSTKFPIINEGETTKP
jgi:hypothetical protein